MAAQVRTDTSAAGLSWDTILRKGDDYRTAFDDFDAKKISRYNQRKIDSLRRTEGIVCNRTEDFVSGEECEGIFGSTEGIRIV
jgi:3-methyladenine DNA glycosylase Tag